jgi:hypothetical protein
MNLEIFIHGIIIIELENGNAANLSRSFFRWLISLAILQNQKSNAKK